MDAPVNVQHERIEVDALLLICRRCVVEQIHDHGLATPNSSVDVEAFGGINFFPYAKPCGQETRLAGGCVSLDRIKCVL